MPTMTQFSSDQFIATQWTTEEEKAKFTNQFTKFVLGGFQEGHFPKWFYEQLSLTFGHIAHYNRNGFYNTWFADVEDQKRFIEQLCLYTPTGDPTYSFSDVEYALVKWANDHKFEIDEVLQQNAAIQEAEARAEHDRIQKLNNQASKKFKVFGKSTNTGAFGHKKYLVMAENGTVYSIQIIPSNLELEEGQLIDVPLCNGEPNWSKFNVECPQKHRTASQEIIDQFWK